MGRGILLALSLSSMLGRFVALIAGGRSQGEADVQYYPIFHFVIPIDLIVVALSVAAWTVYVVAFCKRASPPKRRYYRRIRFEGAERYFDHNIHEYTLDRSGPALQSPQAVYEIPPREEYEFIPPDAIKWQGLRKSR